MSPARVRAPELLGRGWLNTDRPLRLADLRGRFVLLDFWTFCCVNCLHVLDELRPVADAWAAELVVVGVHSPKFEHEADPAALRAAVARYGVDHPVLDDPDLVTWQAYAARAWPTLVLVDPEGYVVAQYAGEGHAHAIHALVAELVPRYSARGTLRPAGSPYVAPSAEGGDLRFPASAVRLPDGRLLIADAGHDAVTLVAAGAVVRRYPGFREPNGLCLLPDPVAAEVGYDVVVADTVAHRLAGLSLASGAVRTVAGDGRQWLPGSGVSSLSSPWDVAWWRGRVWVAMAGTHQLWTFDPLTSEVAMAAGTGHEGLVDGPAYEAWFAQPSGLAPDGDRLWVADAETSAVRCVSVVDPPSVVEPVETRSSVEPPSVVEPVETLSVVEPVETLSVVEPPLVVEPVETRSSVEPPPVVEPVETRSSVEPPPVVEPVETRSSVGPPSVVEPVETRSSVGPPPVVEPVETILTVTTAVGLGLFDFGFCDGDREEARLQHPLGVAVDADGTVLVADTYNGAVRRWNPASGRLSTVATGLAEPSGLVVGEPLLVVESAEHRLTAVVPADLSADGRSTTTQRPVTSVAADVELRIPFTPPPGQKVDDRFGPASQLVVSATPAALLRSGDGRGADLSRGLRLDPAVGDGVLHVAARAATCDEGAGEGAACRMHQQDWGIPVRVTSDGLPVLDLPLGGTR